MERFDSGIFDTGILPYLSDSDAVSLANASWFLCSIVWTHHAFHKLKVRIRDRQDWTNFGRFLFVNRKRHSVVSADVVVDYFWCAACLPNVTLHNLVSCSFTLDTTLAVCPMSSLLPQFYDVMPNVRRLALTVAANQLRISSRIRESPWNITHFTYHCYSTFIASTNLVRSLLKCSNALHSVVLQGNHRLFSDDSALWLLHHARQTLLDWSQSAAVVFDSKLALRICSRLEQTRFQVTEYHDVVLPPGIKGVEVETTGMRGVYGSASLQRLDLHITGYHRREQNCIWIISQAFRSLRFLRIAYRFHTEVVDDDVELLGALPGLTQLELSRARGLTGAFLFGGPTHFQQLQLLTLRDCPEVSGEFLVPAKSLKPRITDIYFDVGSRSYHIDDNNLMLAVLV